jgi:hypothetical protein
VAALAHPGHGQLPRSHLLRTPAGRTGRQGGAVRHAPVPGAGAGELADLVFAIDSVPAIFAITTDPYIVYTSNIMA